MEKNLTAPIITAIAEHLEVEQQLVDKMLGAPSKAGIADFALPCFQFAKARSVPPPAVASELAEILSEKCQGVSAQAAGPFLNITLSPEYVSSCLLPLFAQDPVAALRSDIGAGQNMCIDFSSPNIAKHLAFHHIRSTGIGNSISKSYEACGWNVTRINFLGDWGTAFGRLIAGWKREGLSLADVEQADDKVLFFNQLYVRISQAGKDDQQVAEEAREWSRKCENDDPEALELWGIIREASLDAAKLIYQLLDIEFDDWNGEAHYRKDGQAIIEELTDKGLLSESEGAQVVDLSNEGFKKPCLILRGDGGSLYATRDMAACEDRQKRYQFNRSLYVVDLGQSLHFKEWFAVMEKLERPYADNLRHVGFGVIQMWNEENERWEKTATRNGVPMMLMDILQEAIQRARNIIEEKNPELPEAEKQSVAEAVGCGAVLFNDLKNNRKGDVKFKFEEALNMQGETGPYLQFAHARLCSIERKFADLYPDSANLVDLANPVNTAKVDPTRIQRDDEKAVLIHIARLQSQLERCVENDDPSILAHTIIDLASLVSSWLSAGSRDHSARVLCDDPATASARLQLVHCTRITIGEGLRLLGLQAPKRM